MTHDPICRECNQKPCVCARGVPATDLEQAARALLESWDADDCFGFTRDLEALRAALAAETGRVSVPREPTEAMVDAPRQILLYAETPGRTLEGLRAHLVACGVDYLSWAPVWATRECGHLTKGAIAILVYHAMLAAAQEDRDGS